AAFDQVGDRAGWLGAGGHRSREQVAVVLVETVQTGDHLDGESVELEQFPAAYPDHLSFGHPHGRQQVNVGLRAHHPCVGESRQYVRDVGDVVEVSVRDQDEVDAVDVLV